MPLFKGKSKADFGHNVEEEMHSGKPMKQSLAIAYSMKRKAKKMASGGMIEQEAEDYADDDGDEGLDMVGRAMKRYSKGGQVANDVGVAEADDMPAEYDDLVLRDDDMESADYTGANSGDELGNAAEDEDRSDIVARVMRSRSKKDRMPRPA